VHPRRGEKSAQRIDSKGVEERPLRRRVCKMKKIKGKEKDTLTGWNVPKMRPGCKLRI
jgi:hypothetical protein